MPANDTPNLEYLRTILDYAPETGLFTWKVRKDVTKTWNTRYAGTLAHSVGSGNRIRISIGRVRYKAHRLAWAYVHGEIPLGMHIDHIDGDTSNNRIANLRLATHAQNAANSRPRRPLKGAYPAPKGRWRSHIKVNQRLIYLGHFATETEAHAAYCTAAREYFGEFMRI
ncbi:MAG TPA: HNH endonuclease signature motif containing protein [Bryobacteraceae bacterium]|nr:HNH endonuclease signature motif containing protein [Bryobacteraceae bacterium]